MRVLVGLMIAASAWGQELTPDEVRGVVANALSVAGNQAAIAVSDRAGNALAIYRQTNTSDADVEKASSLARTGAFFISFGTPLSSRTVRAISRPNFPEGIPNQPAGALFGIENTNRGCTLNVPGFPQLLNSSGTGYSLGIATVAGGVPLFRDGVTVIGGVGVSGAGTDDQNEAAAVAGSQAFFVKLPLPDPGAVYIDGFRLPFVNASPGAGQPVVAFVDAIGGTPAPEGWLIGPNAGSVLSASDVGSIVMNAKATADLTRAAIRLPLSSRAKMMIAVADLDGTILGLYRMTDSVIFSVDVAITKARNMVYFSSAGRDPRDLPGVPLGFAVTNRTIGFGSQPFFPSGIINTKPGPFADMLAADIANPCTQGHQAANANQSGIVFFPGSAALYRNGVMVGGLGVSGDGVEQDDFVTAGGAAGYEAPEGIRADQVFIRGVRLPYWKFPRNPEQ